MSIKDYLPRHKDLPKMDYGHPLNEFDNAVFSLVTYRPLTYVPREDSSLAPFVTIRTYCKNTLAACTGSSTPPPRALNRDDDLTLREHSGRQQDELWLLRELQDNARYADVKIGWPCVANDVWDKGSDPKDCAQFAAVTFELPYKDMGRAIKVIAFRGTNNTLVGWKENLYFALGYPTKVKNLAYKYTKRAIIRNPGEKFAITGHSKGGHLAVDSYYSVIYSFPDIDNKKDVLEDLFYKTRAGNTVTNFDGPGVSREKLRKIERSFGPVGDFKERVVTYGPQTAIFSLLFEDGWPQKKMHFVTSSAQGVYQHAPETWVAAEVFNFSREDRRSPFFPGAQNALSRAITRSVREFLGESLKTGDKCARFKEFVDIVFYVLDNGEEAIPFEPKKDDIIAYLKKLCSFPAVREESFRRIVARFTDIVIAECTAEKGDPDVDNVLKIAGVVQTLFSPQVWKTLGSAKVLWDFLVKYVS